MQLLRLVTTMLVAFAGVTVARASPKVALDPSTLNFSSIAVGGSAQAPYNVTNTGTTKLVVMDMQIVGPDADQFHFDDSFDSFCGLGRACTPNFQLAPGASRTFSVVCVPSRLGAFTATLKVSSNAADREIALTCAGATPASMSTLVVSPASIDFGVNFAEPAFPAALDRTLTVTNTAAAPSVPVDFQVIVPGTTGNGFFTLPAGQFGFLGPGESQDFVIRFQWNGGVTSTAPLVLKSSDPSQPSIQVPMFAETAFGRLVFDDPPGHGGFIGMPAVAAGDTSSVTIRAHNDGDFVLRIDRAFAFITIGGNGELDGPFRQDLAPGESIEWTLTCTPDGSQEDGAFGTVEFSYVFSAIDFETFSWNCPLLSPPPPLAAPGARALGAPAIARIEPTGSVSTEAGGCSAATPTSVAPLGLLLLGWLVPGRRARRKTVQG